MVNRNLQNGGGLFGKKKGKDLEKVENNDNLTLKDVFTYITNMLSDLGILEEEETNPKDAIKTNLTIIENDAHDEYYKYRKKIVEDIQRIDTSFLEGVEINSAGFDKNLVDKNIDNLLNNNSDDFDPKNKEKIKIFLKGIIIGPTNMLGGKRRNRRKTRRRRKSRKGRKSRRKVAKKSRKTRRSRRRSRRRR